MTREEKQKAINALKISAPLMAVTQEEFNDYIQTLNKVMDWLEQEPTTKDNLGVDCISRVRAIERLKLNFPISEGADNSRDRHRYMQALADLQAIKELPPVTPQEPTDKIFTRADLDSMAKAINYGWELRVNEVLDKIRAEIAEYGSIMVAYAITKDTKTDKGIQKLVSGVLKQAKDQVLNIIDKYMAETEDT